MGINELNYINNTRGIISPNIDELAYSGVRQVASSFPALLSPALRLRNYYVNPICPDT